MGKFVITGGNRPTGEVIMSDAKNTTIAIIPAAIMVDDICRIENIPNTTDVTAITQILYDMGAKIQKINSSTIEIDPGPIYTYVASYELTRHVRDSYYLLSALLGRFRHVMVSMPGGCDPDIRPINQRLKGFGVLGATYALEDGMMDVSAKEFIGNNTCMNVVSVGATINIMLAAMRARDTTIIENAAKEPHIVDLASFLNSMEADVRGAGTDVIKIHGIGHLKGVTYSIVPDQTGAGTYIAAAAATGGDVLIKNVVPKHLESISAKLEEMGVTVEEYDDSIRTKRNQPLNRYNTRAMPHPGFPTNMQPQITVVLSIAHGTSIVNESVWDNRFHYVEKLRRMGAQISIDGKPAIMEGADHLNAAPVRATDLHASAVTLIAALCAHGVSQVEGVQHIEHGYEDVEKELLTLSADVKRVHVPNPSMTQAV